jgi:predicted nucleotidyltransferase
MTRALQAELEAKRDALAALCRKHGVARLDLFGAGTTEDWNLAQSDLDFIVAFCPDLDRSLADRYLGLADELEALFRRQVDLLTERAIRDPYFRRNVEATRAPVYAE